LEDQRRIEEEKRKFLEFQALSQIVEESKFNTETEAHITLI